MIGTSILDTADTRQIQEAGVGWVRQSFRFPFVDQVGGNVSEEYRENRASAERLRAFWRWAVAGPGSARRG